MRVRRGGGVGLRCGGPSVRRPKLVALLGGSFNPPHDGHLYICRKALDILRPDRLIVIPALCNPLKAPADMAPFPERLALCRTLFAPVSRVVVSDMEGRRSMRFTLAVLRHFHNAYPGARLVWIIGSDNLGGLHRWRGWRALVRLAGLVVVARGPLPVAAEAPALRLLGRFRIPATPHAMFGAGTLPRWCFLDVPVHPASSTAIRAEHCAP